MSGELLAIDTPWLLYRSHFALPSSIRGVGGARVGALLGTVNTVLGLAQWGSPRAVVCCMGAEEADYRVALYPPYHAHREPMPDELRTQWEQAPELLEALGWIVSADEALEADDLMWSYSRVEAKAGGRTLICSGDRDLYQAVDEHTEVLELRRDGPPATIDAAEVAARSGVDPGPYPRPDRPPGRPLRRAAGREGHRREDRRRADRRARLARGSARSRRRAAPADRGDTARAGRGAARLPPHRDASGHRGHAAAGCLHRSRPRRAGGTGARHEPARETARGPRSRKRVRPLAIARAAAPRVRPGRPKPRPRASTCRAAHRRSATAARGQCR